MNDQDLKISSLSIETQSIILEQLKNHASAIHLELQEAKKQLDKAQLRYTNVMNDIKVIEHNLNSELRLSKHQKDNKEDEQNSVEAVQLFVKEESPIQFKYKSSLTWQDKALYILYKNKPQPMSTAEIVDSIMLEDGKFNPTDRLERRSHVKSLSSVLGQLAKLGKIKKIELDNNQFKYSLL